MLKDMIPVCSTRQEEHSSYQWKGDYIISLAITIWQTLVGQTCIKALEGNLGKQKIFLQHASRSHQNSTSFQSDNFGERNSSQWYRQLWMSGGSNFNMDDETADRGFRNMDLVIVELEEGEGFQQKVW